MANLTKGDKIYVAGHRGLVGSAIVRSLKRSGYDNIIGRTHSELDLTDQRAVREFFEAEKPVAAICHAPWLLIDSKKVEGRKLTSYTSVMLDLQNAGAEWVDEEVVVDGNLITSRNPGDLEAFNKAIIAKLS